MKYLLALAALVASPALAQVVYPPVFVGALATKAEVQAAQAKADAAATAAQLSAVAATVPTAATSAPPSVADASVQGNIARYAMENHTHASKARKGRVLVPISGIFDVTFASPMGSSPLCAVTAEATSGDTNVVNAQVDGVTSTAGLRIRITRTQQSVVVLLGLTILSVPTQVATYAHYICIEP